MEINTRVGTLLYINGLFYYSRHWWLRPREAFNTHLLEGREYWTLLGCDVEQGPFSHYRDWYWGDGSFVRFGCDENENPLASIYGEDYRKSALFIRQMSGGC